MGADHEADPAGPDQTSHDHADGQAFSVWTPRGQGGGPAPPAPADYEPPDEPTAPAQASHDEQDGPAGPASGPVFPKRVPGANGPLIQTPAEPESGPVFPKRVPGGSGLPTRSPSQAGGPGLPARPPVAPDADSSLLARTLQGLGGNAAPPSPPGQPDGGTPALPARAPQAAGDGSALPARAPRAPGDGSVLPVRTTRYRRPGRHSSPHLLSLPSDTPALVIAVPGSARPESEDIAIRVAEAAGTSCHGAEIRIGYLRGNQDLLADVLDDLGSPDGGPAAVVVPLLAFPNPEADAAIAEAVASARTPFLIAGHLGPHPLLAEAVHARLADAGLARASRVGRISIVTGADGIIVGAAGDDEALEGAGVVAVLLASRLTMPVAAASLTDPGSIKDAANRLREARVARIALAPCMVGPELTSGTLDAIAALTRTDCAPPLGGHPAVAQLVAIRYGAALADPQVASMMAAARGETLSNSGRTSSVAPGAGSVSAGPPPATAQ